MRKGKEVVIKGIQEVKNNETERLNKLEEEVRGSSDKVELYSKIIDIGMDKREILTEYLKEVLEDDFFKGAKILNSMNGIVFIKDDIWVMFPVSRYKRIEIEYVGDLESPRKLENKISRHNVTINWYKEAIKLLEDYLEKKSLSKLKKLKEHDKSFGNNSLGVIGMFDDNKIDNYIKVYKSYNKEMLKEFKENIEKDKKVVKETEIKLEEVLKKSERLKEYVLSIKDIQDFKKAGFLIKEVGVR